VIREATIEDLPEILRMAELFCDQADLPFSPESVVDTVTQMLDLDSAIVFVSDGAMAGALSYPMFTDKSVISAEELFWWVDSGQRSNGIGRKLKSKIEEWAKSVGASRMLMSGLASSPAHVDAFYRKSGYDMLETKYWKEL